MISKRNAIITITALLVLAGSLPMITNADDGPSTRFPVLKTGSIASDEIWSEDVLVLNATINSGVKVTVQAGVTVYMGPLSSLNVDGELVIAGTVEEKVEIRCLSDGAEWRSIEISSSGKVDLQNVTITDTLDSNTPLIQNGLPSYFKNIELEGGHQGIWFAGEGGDQIFNMKVYNSSDYCVVLLNSNDPINIQNLTTMNSGLSSVLMQNYAGCEINGMTAYNHTISFFNIISTTSVNVSDFSFRNPTLDIHRNGIYMNGLCEIKFTNGVIDNCNRGLFLEWTDVGTSVNFDNVDLEKTNIAVELESHSNGALRFTDCDLNVNNNTVILDGSSNPQRVEFINTTWNGESPNEIVGDAYLNVSWHMDVRIMNGIGEPIDSRLTVQPSGGGSPYQMNSNVGEFNKILMKDRSIDPSGDDLIYLYDLTFMSNDHPGEFQTFNSYHVGGYTFFGIEIDLPPSNDLPGNLDVDEDQWLELELYDHFTDPESLEMEFEFKMSPSIDLVQTGGSTSGDIMIRNKEPDWHGTGWVEITATDSGGKTTTANTTVEVHAVNDAPVFTEVIPEFEMIEEGTGYFNFTGIVVDPEGDAMTWTIPDAEGLDLDWDEENLNLTFTGIENWFGLTGMDVNVTDGLDWTVIPIVVNVTPVNDIPTWSLMLKNGTEAPMMEYIYNETTNWTVYLIETDEDLPVEFWINASDAEAAELLYSFVGADLLHGIVEVEMYQIEVIVNATTNETEMQDITVPMNFTYSPLENDHLGDIVMFNVSDGEETVSYRVWFKVAPINDPPVFTAPSEWNITVDMDTLSTIDLADMISDIDEDAIIIAEDSDFITVNGTILEILYTGAYTETSEAVTVTVSDGNTEVTATLLININVPADDDDDDEPTIDAPRVIAEEYRWIVEAEGTEGQDLWIVLGDEDGNVASYKMSYSDGKYTAEIPIDDAKEGQPFWISYEEDGAPIDLEIYDLALPALKQVDEDGFPIWIVILIIVIVILVIAILVLMVTGKRKGDHYYDEE